jgi:hypothetical protein
MSEEKTPLIETTQIRLGRPTNQLEALLNFYCRGLGMESLLTFAEDPAGYSGVVLGLPGQTFHLELCSHRLGFKDCRPPTRDNLLVFYLNESIDMNRMVEHMGRLGYPPVPATNPHWEQNGVTFEDPDGWRIVLIRRSNVQN